MLPEILQAADTPRVRAHADLKNHRVHRGVRERGERHAGQHFEERHRHRVIAVHQRDVREDFLIRGDELLGRERRAVDRDPLPERDQVRAGEPAGAQATAAQQRVGHACRGRLAVGTRDVDDWAGALRVAKQADQLGHPVQGEIYRMFGSPGEQLALDLTQPCLDIHAAQPTATQRYSPARRTPSASGLVRQPPIGI